MKEIFANLHKQIVTGIGLGMSLQQPAIAIQTVLKDDEIPIGTSALNFAVFLGGSVFVTVGQTIFQRQLIKKLLKIEPSLDPSRLSGSSAVDLKNLVPPARQHEALAAYSDSMRAIWYLGLALAALAFFASFGLGWKNVKTHGKDKAAQAHGDGAAAEKQ